MTILERIDSTAKGVKTYLASGIGVVIVAVLQSQGIDAVDTVDQIAKLLSDTVVQVVALQAFIVGLLRKAMPDKRG